MASVKPMRSKPASETAVQIATTSTFILPRPDLVAIAQMTTRLAIGPSDRIFRRALGPRF